MYQWKKNKLTNNWHCNQCRMCNRYDSPDCVESCRLCGEYMFTEDKKNVYTNPFNPYRYESLYYYPSRLFRPFYYYMRPIKQHYFSYYKKPMNYAYKHHI